MKLVHYAVVVSIHLWCDCVVNHSNALSSLLYLHDDVMQWLRIDDKLKELKAYFNNKFKEQEEKLTKTFSNIIDDLKKEITVQIQNET